MDEKKILDSLNKLREREKTREKKRNFDQTLDLIINLKDIDVRKHSLNIFVNLSKKYKDKKIAAFLEKDSKLVEVIKKNDFVKYKEKKDIKKLLKKYDNFIASAKVMPAVATSFGRVLGPAGKMPSPQLGIVPSEDDNLIKNMVEKINSTVRVIVKEPSIKIGVGKESLNDEDLKENIFSVYKKILENLPKGRDNIRNVKIKFTMCTPVAIEI